MARITVQASRTYEILVDEQPLESLGYLAKTVTNASKSLVISDANVAPLYADSAIRSLAEAGIPSSLFSFPAGEASKTLSTYASCLDACCEAGLSRNDAIIALGGGVVGDVAGFTAATYMRGCSCIQVPTSLLACVDSSVGGKTAVDLPTGKNLVGAFFQPNAVLIDTSVLATLDPHFFVDGCAEIIKYGAIADAELLAELSEPLKPEDSRLPAIIQRCVSIKRDIVSADEHETGIRQLLNFGHTIGHAIERLSSFSVTHGFAVACGMALAANGGSALGITSDDARLAILAALDHANLPTSLGDCGLQNVTAHDIYQAALSDKKRFADSMHVILATTPGHAKIVPMKLPEFEQFVASSFRKER